MKKVFFVLFVLYPTLSFSNGIKVSAVAFNDVTNKLSFTLEWENSWSYLGSPPLMFDAAWVFIKYAPNGGNNWYHAPIVNIDSEINYASFISYDSLGVMIYKSTEGSSNFIPQQFEIELGSLSGGYQDFKVFATEMVFIDALDFYAGDGLATGRFYADGDTLNGWHVTNENGIMRGNGPGEFNQVGSTSTTDIPASFPKGYTSFISMKYKITAHQYIDFLNCLQRTQQDSRVLADLSGTVASNKYVMTNTATVMDRNPIACDINIGTGPIEFFVDLDASNPPNSPNDGSNIVLNHLSVNDILAYLDWSGMRPMSELEYEKICRGAEVIPVGNEYAWATDTYNSSGSITNGGLNNESTSNVDILPSLYQDLPLRAGYAATDSSGRIEAGATFWGNMDVHNLGEFMVGVENSSFTHTSHGDGTITTTGDADVSDWLSTPHFLSTQNPSTPGIAPISMVKNSIGLNTRSAYLGGRGVRRVIIYP